MDHQIKIGQIERATQNRVVHVFQDVLDYGYLGNWETRGGQHIEEDLLSQFLQKQGYSEILTNKAIEELKKTAGNQSQTLYETNRDVYSLLRYGAKVRPTLGENTKTVYFIDWQNPQNNHFAIAEEVSYTSPRSGKTKRPDIVIYINGIAVGVIELKRSSVSVSEGIRQNIGNQRGEWIQEFFTTVQFLFAGNDTEGLRYGTIETPEEYYLEWSKKDESFGHVPNRLDRQLAQICQKERFLELIYDFIVFDSGIKKVPRHNQYFAVKAAQDYVKNHKSGIIWHTQGSGKSLTMVWLAKWIRENMDNGRVLILTDRVELDEQIEKVFKGVRENIYRAKSGRDLLTQLNSIEKPIIGSLVHKFGRSDDNQNVDDYIAELKTALPSDFSVKGDLFVFVDECHRTHTGKLHQAMKEILPRATFIGFTGTPLLNADKTNSLLTWGPYIHTYKYDEAVKDHVVLDLRYEARRVAQNITSQDKIDQWFEERTKGLTDFAKAQLKRRWGTMQSLLSSKSRLEKIVFDILDDFYKKPRLASGYGNAMLVASSIYEACQYYEIFISQGFEKCAVVTSYTPNALDTDSKEYRVYQHMLQRWGETDVAAFERKVKKLFIEEPAQMQLLIVVDKLLTGFDAPPATYLYIDKNMQDHGLFQAICRVNRLHTEDKEYGYIIDYRDLFQKLEKAVTDYTSGAFENFDKEDVVGLLKDSFEESKKGLEELLESVRGLCEPVEPPKGQSEFIKYFCGDVGNPYSLKENEFKRVRLYKLVGKLLRAYAEVANDLDKLGYDQDQQKALEKEVRYYESVAREVKLASGDYINLKAYEPAMRALMDRYISARESEQLADLTDKGLVDLLIEKGAEIDEELKEKQVLQEKEALAEAIINNIRRLIIDETPNNPKYYQRMSELLEELIRKKQEEDLVYKEYLEQLAKLAKQVKNPADSNEYPNWANTPALRALYDNLPQRFQDKALELHQEILQKRQDSWQDHPLKERALKNIVKKVLHGIDEDELENIFEVIKNQHEY